VVHPSNYHKRYRRQTDRRQTDGRQQIANVNVSSRSLKIEGQSVCQLCVPTARRDSILELAHNSVYGGHLGERKTCQSIKLSFYRPGLKRSVRDYVMSCQDC